MRAWFDRLANRGVVLFVGAIVLTVVFVSLFNVSVSRQELERQARAQVKQVAQLVAFELDRKLTERFDMMADAAANLSMDAETFRRSSSDILARHRPFRHLFEYLALIDDQGIALNSYPEVPGFAGVDLSDRGFFKDSARQFTPLISEPYQSPFLDEPHLVMAAPVFDGQGGFIGVFAGSVTLDAANFLSEVSRTRIGRQGYITIATRSGQILAQEGRDGDLRSLPQGDELSYAAMAGYEGVRLATDEAGETLMVAIQQLNSAPWFVVASWPLEDAYSAANRLQDNLLMITVLALLVLLPIAYGLFRRYLNPLLRLADQIRDCHQGIRQPPVDAGGYLEIRELAESFNRAMSGRLEVEARLRAERARAEGILRVLQEGVVMIDRRFLIRYVNPAAESFLGTVDGLVGAPLFQMLSFESDGQQWSVRDFLDSGEILGQDGVLRNGRQQAFDVEITLLHLSHGDEYERLVLVIRDDSERRRHEQKLSWQASHDSLTGLMNRRAFRAELLKWLAKAAELEAASALMLIDLDHFKPVNDEGGHLAGDELLRKLASVLRDSVRRSDVVARLGGDEFAILLPACGLERAEVLTEQVRAGIESCRLSHEGREYGVTASIGLTELSVEDSGPREVMARADEAAYTAKAQGRNQVVVVATPDET